MNHLGKIEGNEQGSGAYRARARRSARAGESELTTTALSIVLLLILGTPGLAQDTPPSSGNSPAIKVEVDLVMLYVTVAERNGRPFTGLKVENFRIYDNEMEQKIHHFSTEDVPFTMGLVLDRSGSMVMVIDEVYQAAFHTVRASKPDDEFFILTFNNRVELRQDFSTNREQLQKRLKGVRADGRTALYDAVFNALNHIQRGSHSKKALLVVTDGDDNSSAHSFRDLLEYVRQRENVAIYVVGFFGDMSGSEQRLEKDSLQVRLTQLAEATGGKAYFPRTMEECDQVCISIAEELRRQYGLGYYPRSVRRDGSWHSVQIRLQVPAELAGKDLTVLTRAGYFAPRD